MIEGNDLRRLQLLELKILKEIKRVCDKNDIRYFLTGGTLIGAIRHNGFIPWDDDIDICMTRENFDKFEQIANSELGSDFFFQTPNTDLQCKSYACGRVRLEGTHFLSNSLPNNWIHNGIFVDILPLEKTSCYKLPSLLYFYFFNLWIRILWHKNGYNPRPKNKLYAFVMNLSFLFSFLISNKFLEKKISNYHKRYTKLKKYKFLCFLDFNFNSGWTPRKLLDNFELHKFEDDFFYIPTNYDSYLRKTYGDYMQLPSEKERQPHHIINIDFGKFSNVNDMSV